MMYMKIFIFSITNDKYIKWVPNDVMHFNTTCKLSHTSLICIYHPLKRYSINVSLEYQTYIVNLKQNY